MMKLKIYLFIFWLLIFCACNAMDHQCDDTCDRDIEIKRSELNNLELNIERAKLRARRINHYVKKRIEELKKLYSSEEDENSSERTNQITPMKNKEDEKVKENDAAVLKKVLEKDPHKDDPDLDDDEDYDKCEELQGEVVDSC